MLWCLIHRSDIPMRQLTSVIRWSLMRSDNVLYHPDLRPFSRYVHGTTDPWLVDEPNLQPASRQMDMIERQNHPFSKANNPNDSTKPQ